MRTPATLLDRIRESVGMPTEPLLEPPGGRRRASVLLLFDPSSEHLPLLFMLRSKDLRFHAGQIAFPGGTAEPGDKDVVATALREAEEEVGLAPGNVEVIGLLSPLVTATSERWLTPVVGVQRAGWQVRGDRHEVATWFRVGLDELLMAPHTVREFQRDGVAHPVHFYEAEGHTIWGVSAAILHELLTRLGRQD
jgi:8-oxo-dGTP pyrophosphatase MutT (NUDIX family)